MNLTLKIVLYVLALTSCAAGLTKILKTPQEAAFFLEAGLGNTALVAFGVLQLAGGVLVLVSKIRQFGLLIVIAGFFSSVCLIAATGNMTFTAVSCLPVIIGIGLLLHERRTKSIARGKSPETVTES